MTRLSTEQRPESGVSDAFALLSSNNNRLVSLFGSLDEDGTRRVHYLVDV